MSAILSVHVKPNAKQEKLVINSDGSLTTRIRARPVDGQANNYLVKYLANELGIAKSLISIDPRSMSSKTKSVHIGLDKEKLNEALARLV
jgi:hypothetical protein